MTTPAALIKKTIKFSSYKGKFRVEQLQSHILTASSYMGKYLPISSYIRKPFLIYNFATAPLWISLYMRKIWLTASSYMGNICAFPHTLGRPSSYMTLQLLHSEFPYIWEKFDFLFYQCDVPVFGQLHQQHQNNNRFRYRTTTGPKVFDRKRLKKLVQIT